MITAMPRIAIATRNFDAAVAWFRDGLGMPVADISAGSVASLGARLAMCVPLGGSNIELMAPADPTAPLAQSLGRFLDRRGDGLFALMLEAPDPNAEAELLGARGLEVLPLMPGASGRDVHPRSTCGVLVRVYPVNSFVPSADQVRRNESRAIGLTGIVRVIVAVRDIERAVEVYEHRFGIATESHIRDEQRGVSCAVARPPSGGTIELAAMSNGQRAFAAAIAAHVSTRGEGLFAIVLQARDLGAAVTKLRARGIGCAPFLDQPNVVELDRTQSFGARVLIEGAAKTR